jgi:hypothetical protein
MRTTSKWALSGAVVIALGSSSFAVASGENSGLRAGARNPSDNQSRVLTRETEIIANTSSYGTRQSNKSDNGGGAIYGCRSKLGGTAAGKEPCVRASNLADGSAFEFSTEGPLGGSIFARGGDNAKPFVTNATGVATGLNADRVDSKSADEIAADGAKAAVAQVQAGVRFAAVGANGALGAQRGVTSARAVNDQGTYEIVFADDASSCAFQATETTTDNAGAVGVSLGGDKKTLTLRTRAGGGPDGTEATLPAPRPFHVVANCL